jgi:hypothetical protein
MKPTVGRIVHYTNLGDKDGRYPPETQAAIITAVKPHDQFHAGQPPPNSEENIYQVSLHIFYATGQFDMSSVPWSEKPERGHWNWPPRESS